jgi:hypothetical protein
MSKTDELAMARMAEAASQLTEGEKAERRRIQAGIDATMSEVIREQMSGRGYDPWRQGSGTTKVVPAGAAPVKDAGWAEPRPMAPQGSDDKHIERIANALAPHGPANPLNAMSEDLRKAQANLREAGESLGKEAEDKK